jgi:hypothetical protein
MFGLDDLTLSAIVLAIAFAILFISDLYIHLRIKRLENLKILKDFVKNAKRK